MNRDANNLIKVTIMAKDEVGHKRAVPLLIYEPSGTLDREHFDAHTAALLESFARVNDGKLGVNICNCSEKADEDCKEVKFSQVRGYFCAPLDKLFFCLKHV